MNRKQIRARMDAVAREAKDALADLNSGDAAKVREAGSKHGEWLDEFESLARQLRTMNLLDDDPQFAGLATRASVAEIIAAVVEHREVDGASRELQQE